MGFNTPLLSLSIMSVEVAVVMGASDESRKIQVGERNSVMAACQKMAQGIEKYDIFLDGCICVNQHSDRASTYSSDIPY